LWETPPELGLVLLRGKGAGLQAWGLSPDGGFAATGAGNGQFEVWDTATGRRLGKPPGHPHAIHALTFSADGPAGLIGTARPDKQGDLHFWDRATEQPAWAAVAHESAVWAVAYSSDGRHIATGTEGGKIRVWDATTARLRYSVEHPKTILSLHFSPD